MTESNEGKEKEIVLLNKPPEDIYQKTPEDIDKLIEEQELKIKNFETKCNALEQEAKAKLRDKDRSGAASLLAKKNKYVNIIKELEDVVAKLNEQKMVLENIIKLRGIKKTIKNTYEVVKEAAKELNIDEVDKMKEEIDDHKAEQEELTRVIKEMESKMLMGELEAQLEKEELPSANEEVLNPSQPLKVENKEEGDLNKFLGV